MKIEDVRLAIFVNTEKGVRQVCVTPEKRNAILDIITEGNKKINVIDEEVPFDFIF